jgi:hypothetical protein
MSQPSACTLTDRVRGGAVHAQHREAIGFDVRLDPLGDRLQFRAGTHQADSEAHSLVSHRGEQSRLRRGFIAHDPRTVCVAAPSFFLEADVNAKEISQFERNVTRFSAENDFVMSNRNAGVFAGVEPGQILPVDVRAIFVDDQIIGDVVNSPRRDARLHMRGQVLQNARCDTAGLA